MWLKTDLEPVISSAYSEGLERFGDLGLDLPTYADRIDSIIRKPRQISDLRQYRPFRKSPPRAGPLPDHRVRSIQSGSHIAELPGTGGPRLHCLEDT